jgi:hypothetical protein
MKVDFNPGNWVIGKQKRKPGCGRLQSVRELREHGILN